MNLQTSLVVRAAIFVFFGLVLCGIVFEFAGYSAMLMFRSIAEGAFLHPGAWKQSLRWAMPLFITAVGVAISFRCGYFNIGAQGQLYMGALGATFTAYFLNGAAPWILSRLPFLWEQRVVPCGPGGPVSFGSSGEQMK